MREAVKSPSSSRQQSQRASSARATMTRAPLNPAQFTRWLLLILALTCGLLGAALYLEHNGVAQTQAQLTAAYTGVQEDLQSWWTTPKAAPAQQPADATTAETNAATSAVNAVPVRTASDLGLGAGCAANAPNEELALAQAKLADVLHGMLGGMFGKMLALTMLMMSLAVSVVKASPAPAVVGAMTAGVLVMGPSVVAQLMGCV